MYLQVPLKDRLTFTSVCDFRALCKALIKKCTEIDETLVNFDGENRLPRNVVPKFQKGWPTVRAHQAPCARTIIHEYHSQVMSDRHQHQKVFMLLAMSTESDLSAYSQPCLWPMQVQHAQWYGVDYTSMNPSVLAARKAAASSSKNVDTLIKEWDGCEALPPSVPKRPNVPGLGPVTQVSALVRTHAARRCYTTLQRSRTALLRHRPA